MFRKRLEFYAGFVHRGDLCFDIGANLGNRVEVLLALGATVAAIEPQPVCLAVLQRKFRRAPGFVLVPKAVGAKPGRA